MTSAGPATAVLEVPGCSGRPRRPVAEAVLGRAARRAGGRRQPGRADRDRQLRPGPDVGGRAGRLDPGLRLPLRRPVRAGARLRPAGRAASRHERRRAAGRGRGGPPSTCGAPRAAGARTPSPHEAMGHGGHAARHVDGRHGPRHAQPVPRRGDPLGADPAVVADRPGGARLHVPAPFGLRDDVFSLLLSPAGDLLLGLDLLRRRLAGAAGPDAGHDGAGRGRRSAPAGCTASGSPSPAAARCSTRRPPC